MMAQIQLLVRHGHAWMEVVFFTFRLQELEMFGFLLRVLEAGVSGVINVVRREMWNQIVVRIGRSEVQALYSELVGAVVLKEETCPSPADLRM